MTDSLPDDERLAFAASRFDVLADRLASFVFPCKTDLEEGTVEGMGLTKRELFAALCMHKGMALTGPDNTPNADFYQRAAACAVVAADALLAALEPPRE